MAIATGTLTTVAQKGQKSLFIDEIFNVSPNDTPVLARLKETDLNVRTYEWQNDSLPTAATTATLEGELFVATSATPTTILKNTCQFITKNFSVTKQADQTQKWGRKNEFLYQQALNAEAIRTSQEKIILNNQGRVEGTDSTARQTRGLGSWIVTNVSDNGGSEGTDTTARTDVSARAFTESMLLDARALQYANSRVAKEQIIVLGVNARRALQGFGGAGSISGVSPVTSREQADKVIVASVDVYKDEFGTLHVHNDPFVRSSDVFILDTDMLGVGYLLRPGFEEMGKVHIGRAGSCFADFMLIVKNEKSQAAVFDVL